MSGWDLAGYSALSFTIAFAVALVFGLVSR
jgi:hypothetical protein